MNKAKAATKTAMFQALAERSELTKKQVARFFEELTGYLKDELGKKGPGLVNLAGLLKIKRVEKKATPARKGRNPQTGQEIDIPAKPKRTVVRALALKSLKEMVK